MKAINTLDIIIKHGFNLLDVVICQNDSGCRIVKYLLILFLSSSYFVSNAQNNENEFKKVIIEIDREEVYDVNAIIQDHQGYIWMSTNLGLIRYNGIEGKKYNSRINDNSFSNDAIAVLFVDSQGEIWIGSSSGLSKYNSDCDCIYRYPSTTNNPSLTDVRSITEDKNRDLWIGTGQEGLFKFERKSEVFTQLFISSTDSIRLINESINELLVDQYNNLWIGTNSYDSEKGSGLILYNIDSENSKQFLHEPTNPNSLLDNRISSLYEDQQGQILIGTYKCGLHIYDSNSDSLKRISFDANNPSQLYASYTEDNIYGKDPFVRLIHQDQNGAYWISTTGKGINYFNTQTATFKNYDFNLVNPQLLSSLYEDSQGNLWIGNVGGGGLYKTDLFARKYTLNTNFSNIEAAYESPLNPGILWVKSRHGGLAKMILNTNKITKYVHNNDNSKSIGHNWVRSVCQEKGGILWVGLGNGGPQGGGTGDGGIDKMDIKTGVFTHFKLTRNDDDLEDFSYTVYSISEDSDGCLWLGTGPGGLFKSDKDKSEFKHFPFSKNDSLSKDAIINIVLIDSNGDIWASDFKDEGSLYLFNHQEATFELYLKGFKATNVLIDKQGWLLISTWGKGLVHLNPEDGSYIQYTKKDGLPSNESLDIVAGKEMFFWVGTRMGPAKFDAATGEISSIGLPKGRYNYGIFKTLDGQLYFAANNGLLSFYPYQVEGNIYPPQISISDLVISDSNYFMGIDQTNELSLSYDQNDLAFKYTGLHFSEPEKNTYQYRLKPLNDNWINAGVERTARYFNLPPDSYTFEVKAANSDGVWSETSEAINFTIKPAWWTTWWAYAFYIVLTVFLANMFYRFQLSKKMADSESKRLKEVDQLKNALFTNITHEFRTPLTVIKGMTGAIKSNLKNKLLDELESSLDIIDRNSDGLLHLINEMLDLAKIESGKMELNLVQADIIPFIKYLTQSFHSLAEENDIKFSVSSEIKHLEMDFDVNKITAIVTNLISNAIKFTSVKGEIHVYLNKVQEQKTEFFVLEIEDDGLGISKEEQMHIFDKFFQVDNSSSRLEQGTGIGLSLVKEFVELMDGSINVNSKEGKGSMFSVKIPISNNAVLSDGSELISASSISKSSISLIDSREDQSLNEVDKDLPLVLIVEDNVDVAHYIKLCLKGKFQLLHALNGVIGIEMALENIPDIIISDVMMPEKNGFEVCEFLKADELTDHIPIIMLTAKVTFEDRLTGLSHGADAYLTKPFEKAELLTRIDQLILLRKKMLSKFEKTGIDRLLNKNVKKSETKFLSKLITLIHDNITMTDFGSVELALQLHLSESQLYRKLKATSGKSTAVFIRSIRLQKGKEMIQTTDMTISEIAYDVGFKDPSWFSRAFKDEFGYAPSSLSK